MSNLLTANEAKFLLKFAPYRKLVPFESLFSDISSHALLGKNSLTFSAWETATGEDLEVIVSVFQELGYSAKIAPRREGWAPAIVLNW